MSVGEALAEARSRAGISVDELSERTRIRKAVIRSIELDDFDACGGDLFVRGYVRALASAVGLDPRPLIREYNQAHAETLGNTGDVRRVARIAVPVYPAADPAFAAAEPLPPAESVLPAEESVLPAAEAGPQAVAHEPPATEAMPSTAEAGPPAVDPSATSVDIPVVDAPPNPAPANPYPAPGGPPSPPETAPAETGATAGWAPPAFDPEITRADLPAVSPDPTSTVDDLPAVPAAPPPHPDLPGTWVTESPGRPARPRRARRSRGPRGGMRAALLTALVLAVAGIAGGLALSSQSGSQARNTAAIAPPTKPASKSPATTAPKATAKPSPPAQRPVTALQIAGAQAFGPNGLGDGDNPQGAGAVIGHGSHSPWQSQWYATPAFGNLKSGTGLLIDMGHPVTITSVRINLGGNRGANLELRVGNSAGGLSGMSVAARASGVGGTVRLKLSSPEHVRYALIWFTLLPPDGSGTYMATVYHVAVNGR